MTEKLEGDDARLFLEQDSVTEQVFAIGGGVVALHTEKSPGKSAPNEDSAGVVSAGREAAVLAVADGLGGAPAGARASAIAIRAITKAVQDSIRKGTELRDGILNGFEAANDEILALGLGAGTTLTAVEVDNASVRAYNVGDSFMLVTGQRGKVKMQTIPHSPTGYAVESGLLDEKQALHHDERHIISNVAGSTEMRIDIGSPFDLGPKDTLVLASDGLSDNLLLSEIVELVRKGPLPVAARKLAHAAGARMRDPQEGKASKPDDLTFFVFRLD